MFLISKCLTVIEVLVNFGTEQGPACWEVCHCEVDPKVGANMP